MTRFEAIKDEMRVPSELGHELCDLIRECKDCPVGDRCNPYESVFESGFTKWLEEDFYDNSGTAQ